MGLFFIVMGVIVWLMQVIIGVWFKLSFQLNSWTMPVKVLPLVFTALFLFAMRYPHFHWEGVVAADLYHFAYIWLGVVFLACVVSTICLLIYGVLALLKVHALWMGKPSVYVMIGLIAYALWSGYSTPQIKRISITAPQLPKMKIAVVSDAHLGLGVSLNRFDKALKRLEAEKPDILLVLGDVFEYGPNRDSYALRLASVYTPLGAYGVLGNHEYYVGYGDSKQFYKDAHVTLLENQSIKLPNGVQIAGLRDILTARLSPEEIEAVLGGMDTSEGAILLSHTPMYAKQAAWHGIDLMLSGHTHNGQIWPFTYFVKLKFPRIYGLYDVDGMPFYITSGMFYWGVPMRLFAPAEIPIIEVN